MFGFDQYFAPTQPKGLPAFSGAKSKAPPMRAPKSGSRVPQDIDNDTDERRQRRDTGTLECRLSCVMKDTDEKIVIRRRGDTGTLECKHS